MNPYEKLVSEFEDEIDLDDSASLPSGIKGLFLKYRDNNVVMIDKEVCKSSERRCILAEEIGHYKTNVGDIIDQSNVVNIKQEVKGKRWAYNKLVSFQKLADAFESGARSKYEIAEHLDVTEAFLEEALNYYRGKYESYVIVGDYSLLFYPELMFYKKL